MPNILLTNFCNQKCSYCFATDELKKKNKEMELADFKKILNFLKKNNDRTVRLMGGEPTLHSKFKEIVECSLENGFSVQIFTNGIFSDKILDFLIKKKDSIKYSFNINPPEFYLKKTWSRILKNLRALSQFKNCLIGSVVWKKNFKIDYLLELTSKYPIRIIMLRIANPIIGKNNYYFPLEEYSVLADRLIREIKKAYHKGIKIGFGCGLKRSMFSKQQEQSLKKYNVINAKWGCEANIGRFDIDTDLSIFRCFPLSSWKGKKVIDFKSVREIDKYFTSLIDKSKVGISKPGYIHCGPCFAHLLNKD